MIPSFRTIGYTELINGRFTKRQESASKVGGYLLKVKLIELNFKNQNRMQDIL